MDQTILMVGVAVVGFAIILALGFAFAGGENSQGKMVRRAQVIGATAGRDASRRARSQSANNAEVRRKQIVKSLQDQDRAQKKARLTISNKLKQAGLEFSLAQFWMAAAALGVAIFAIAFLIHMNPFIALGLGAASSLGVPVWVLGFLAKRRTNKFTLGFSDGMDIIVRGIKSGLPVHDCLKIIAKETSDPLAGEFSRLVENIGMGMSLDQALDKLFERMPTSEVRFFSIVMGIQQKTGGNLAEALSNLSTVLRARKLMREKVKALSAEATSSAFIIGCLPPGVILLISVWTPAYMAPMFSDHRGWIMLGGSAIWMSLGIFVMAKMINFKF